MERHPHFTDTKISHSQWRHETCVLHQSVDGSRIGCRVSICKCGEVIGDEMNEECSFEIRKYISKFKLSIQLYSIAKLALSPFSLLHSSHHGNVSLSSSHFCNHFLLHYHHYLK